jgi:hypothetical protein
VRMFLNRKCDHAIAGLRTKMHILLAGATNHRKGRKRRSSTRRINFLAQIQKGIIGSDFH